MGTTSHDVGLGYGFNLVSKNVWRHLARSRGGSSAALAGGVLRETCWGPLPVALIAMRMTQQYSQRRRAKHICLPHSILEPTSRAKADLIAR